MAKRAAKKRPGTGEQESRPWLEVVEMVRRKTENDKYRLQILGGLEGWYEFASAWSASAVPILRREYPLESRYTGLQAYDVMNHWAWQQIEETGAVDASLEFVNDIAPLSSLQVITCFDAMRAAMLVYPDGSINPYAMQRVTDAVQAENSRMSIRSTSRAIEDIQKAAALRRLVEKHGG